MMHQIEHNPTTGKIIAKRFTLEEIEEANANNYGLCLACGAERECCEPDARKYRCVSCEHDTVYGAEEIALMGLLK
ncbi:hypothetical protein CCR94_18220 [Rhodoblastus sphagnicola]|uniref:Uncharacterized protein n=1 Tax=Rhodoblastus sphagnicola TaxID=333368 RepID=A0A2S6N0T5_9HYPH|nr:hypothetical protein [Rhodoblastus sphagnicola]MBB4200591.1 hypothetical protein [Rhodoblastus sphagnicola]PPQ28235.1 hypothetical protein CCR94_18220 [Rhodoblastus sphagnicola]